MEKRNKYDIYLLNCAPKINKTKTDAEDLFKLYLHNSWTLQLPPTTYLCMYACIWAVYQTELFLFWKSNVVFHFVHSASSAPTRLSSRSTPKSKSESTLWSHVQSHMHYFACLAIWVFRRKGQKINVDRAVISESRQATGSFHPNNVLHFHISHFHIYRSDFVSWVWKFMQSPFCPAP